MKEGRLELADEGSTVSEQLKDALDGLSRNFCDYEGPLRNGSQADILDLAAAHRDRETSLRLFEREKKVFQDILKALYRIETGDYEICENCGGQIGLGRLKASPTATLCIQCKKEEEACAA